VNFSHPVASTRSKFVFLAFFAALALAVAFVLTSASAPASSGGVETEGTGGGSGKSSKTSRVDSRYKRMWSNVKPRHKRWARKTAVCESGKDPRAIGGGGIYRGAFQFLRSTWRAAPRSPGGDPVRFRYKTQAFVAIALKKRDGAHHWPVCG